MKNFFRFFHHNTYKKTEIFFAIHYDIVKKYQKLTVYF